MPKERTRVRPKAASRRPKFRHSSSSQARLSRAWPSDEAQWRECLSGHGIQVSAPRLSIASYVLTTTEHPSADQVHQRMKEQGYSISRATVYNTLALFERAGLLRRLVLSPGCVVFDPKLERHHHLIDRVSGRIWDIAEAELESARGSLEAAPEAPATIRLGGSLFDIDEVQTVFWGRSRTQTEARASTKNRMATKGG